MEIRKRDYKAGHPQSLSAEPAAPPRLDIPVVPRYIGTRGRRIAIAGGAGADRRAHGKAPIKIRKAFAEYHDLTLGDLLEGIVLHAYDGTTPFSPASLERIQGLKKFCGLDLDSGASHRLKEIKGRTARGRGAEK